VVANKDFARLVKKCIFIPFFHYHFFYVSATNDWQ